MMDEVKLEDFFKSLKRYILVYVILLIVAVGGVVVYDKVIKKPVYTAKTSVLVATFDDESSATIDEVNASQKSAATYVEVVKSNVVLSRVASNFHITMNELKKNITVNREKNTAVVDISVRDLNAESAAKIADELAEVSKSEFVKGYPVKNVAQLGKTMVPSSPSNNSLLRDVALAGIFVTVVVLVIAFLRFYFSVKVPDGDKKANGRKVGGGKTAGRKVNVKKVHKK